MFELTQTGPKRLFASTSHSIIPSKSFGNLQTIRSTKTPAKVTRPAQVTVKQFTTPLPSASKPRRSRQSSTPLVPPVPRFSTPAPKGKEWEEGESLDSIIEGLNELAVSGLALGQIGELEEDDGDVEYAPPRSIREFCSCNFCSKSSRGLQCSKKSFPCEVRWWADDSVTSYPHWRNRLYCG